MWRDYNVICANRFWLGADQIVKIVVGDSVATRPKCHDLAAINVANVSVDFGEVVGGSIVSIEAVAMADSGNNGGD